MDWLKEILTKAGLEEAKADEIIGNVNKELPKYFIPKAKYNEVAEAKKQLEEEIKARDTQLEELKKSAGENETLKKQIEELQTANKQKDEEYQKQIRNLQITNAIKLAVTGKVHDEDLVANLINKDNLILDDDGKIVGLDDQIKALQESKPFLFKGEGNKGFQKIGMDPSSQGVNDIERAISAAFGNLKEK